MALGGNPSRLTVLLTISCLGLAHGRLIADQQPATRCQPGRKGLCRGESRVLLEGGLGSTSSQQRAGFASNNSGIRVCRFLCVLGTQCMNGDCVPVPGGTRVTDFPNFPSSTQASASLDPGIGSAAATEGEREPNAVAMFAPALGPSDGLGTAPAPAPALEVFETMEVALPGLLAPANQPLHILAGR